MSYAVKEMFLTLQGEGVQAGRRAVFVRFAGCNLWSGREEDRATAICKFCDTDFVGVDGLGGGRFADATALVDAIEAFWGRGSELRYVVLTGGEPMLQIDDALVEAVHARGFKIGVDRLAVHQPQSRKHRGAVSRKRTQTGLATAWQRCRYHGKLGL
jgi:7-carboxy-7-deazaguanine synthase